MTTDNAEVSNFERTLSLPRDPSRPLTPVPASIPLRRSPVPGGRRRAWAAGRDTAALAAADCLAAAAAVAPLDGAERAAALLGLAVAVLLVLGARRGLYRPGPAATVLDEVPRLLGHAVIAWCVAAAVLAGLHPVSAPSWAMLLEMVAVYVAAACLCRGAVHHTRRRGRRKHPHSVLVVGEVPTARRVATALHDHPEYGMRPVGLVALEDDFGEHPGDLSGDPAPHRPPSCTPELSMPVLVSPEDITRAVTQNTVREAVFTRSPWADPYDAVLVRLLAQRGCTLWLAHGAQRVDAGLRRPVGRDHLWGFACQRLEAFPHHGIGIVGKRLLDIVLAAVALVVTAPLLLACAIVVRWADGPGVIFRQERIGMAGRPFSVLKFRTLRPADKHESATLWNIGNDERLSNVGRLLRRTSLDELPQLWNVLRGDMSLVGPRPERPYFVEKFCLAYPGYAARHRMPAGITGLAQVHGLHGDTSIEDRARFDNHYIETWSLWQDVQIMLRTAAFLFLGEGRR
jgi:exopolysaccharide biosynthesis polyprenyl glycosylphosphotransferase